MILQEKFTLSNGVKIPKIGFGTWLIKENQTAQSVRDAIAVGYRHIDTAQSYRNERSVGEGVRTSGVSRDEIFVTSKLAAEIKNYKEAVAAIGRSLQTIGLDHIDLMLIHSPQPWSEFGDAERYFEGNREAWRALEDAYKSGKLRSIGISNFEQVDVENLLPVCSVAPHVNQILIHIGNTPFELIKYCQDKDILVEAYSPIAHGEILNNREIAAVAAKYGVSVPQICIRYTLQLDTLPLPKSTNPAHIKDNAAVDFEISDADMDVLKRIGQIEDYGEHSSFPVFGGKK